MYVCVCVCMFQHNSGTPGAISTKLGTHMTIYTYLLLLLLYIYKLLRLYTIDRIHSFSCMIEDRDK
jgi:hypothetical protein